jgi:hypothetical protein
MRVINGPKLYMNGKCVFCQQQLFSFDRPGGVLLRLTLSGSFSSSPSCIARSLSNICNEKEWMNRWIDIRVNGWMDGWVDEWVDEWVDK